MTVTIAKRATKNERIRVAVISQITKFIRTAGVFGFASALFPFCLGKDLLGILDIQVGEKNSTRNLTVLLSNLDFTIRLPFPRTRACPRKVFRLFEHICSCPCRWGSACADRPSIPLHLALFCSHREARVEELDDNRISLCFIHIKTIPFFAEAHFCEIHRWADLRPEPPDFPKFSFQ